MPLIELCTGECQKLNCWQVSKCQQDCNTLKHKKRLFYPTMSYRKVSNGNDIDESLFGKPSGRRPRHNEGKSNRNTPSNNVSRSQLAALGASIAVGNIKDGLVVSRSDLTNFKNMTVIKTHDMVLQERANRNRAREERMKEAQKRKKRMRELEAEGKKHTVKSDLEIIKEAESNALLSNAQKQRDQQEDLVKGMNRMVAYAQCVAVRDKQLSDKAARASAAKEESRLLELRMEIDRLKALQVEEVKRKVVRAKRMEDAKVIRKQKADKELARQMALEAKELEGKQLLEMIAARKKQEAIKTAKKRAEGAILLQEVLQANQESIQAKKDAKQFDLDENERILEYLRQQDLKQKKREEDEAARKARLEEETIRVRAMQEKAQDNSDAEWHRRMLRHTQEQEKKEREQAKAEAAKHKDAMAELARVREQQMRVKQIADAEEAAAQKYRHSKTMSEQREAAAKERAVEIKRTEDSRVHSIELRKQIDKVEEERAHAKEIAAHAADHIREERVRKIHKLKQIRNEKVEMLRKSGVPEKYLTELQRMKITVA